MGECMAAGGGRPNIDRCLDLSENARNACLDECEGPEEPEEPEDPVDPVEPDPGGDDCAQCSEENVRRVCEESGLPACDRLLPQLMEACRQQQCADPDEPGDPEEPEAPNEDLCRQCTPDMVVAACIASGLPQRQCVAMQAVLVERCRAQFCAEEDDDDGGDGEAPDQPDGPDQPNIPPDAPDERDA